MKTEEILKLAEQIRQADDKYAAAQIINKTIHDSWQEGFERAQETTLKTIEKIIK